MSLTVEQICDNVLLELGFGTQSAYAAASTDAGKRVFSLLNREARQLANEPWQKLKKEATFTMVAATYEYSLPSDWRFPIYNTAWATTQSRRVDFPTDDEVWSYLESFSGSSGIRYKARIRNDQIEFADITADDVIRIEYVSDHPWQATGGGSTKARATVDTDVWLLDDEAVQLGLKWRLLKAQGYADWSVEYQEYTRYLNSLRGKETGSQTIMSQGLSPDGPPFAPYTELWVS